uniref:TRAPP14 N-terminal domain-containing protein n=1 Tax=Catharus ustulatus TaxID=91951 RepID=A0A8C3Y5T6_CATUS
MESQCDYSMYFPAVPFPPREFLAGESSGYRSLPRRNHLYLGETVRFLLVLGMLGVLTGMLGLNLGNSDKNVGNSAVKTPWMQLASSLSALATVTSGDSAGRAREEQENPGNSSGNSEEPPLFRECRALLTHSRGAPGPAGLPVDDPIVSQDEVIFPLTVALDRLPPGTAKAKVGTLGDSWGQSGDNLGTVGDIWGTPGDIFGQLRTIWGQFGDSWDIWGHLGTIWGHLGTFWGQSGDIVG